MWLLVFYIYYTQNILKSQIIYKNFENKVIYSLEEHNLEKAFQKIAEKQKYYQNDESLDNTYGANNVDIYNFFHTFND